MPHGCSVVTRDGIRSHGRMAPQRPEGWTGTARRGSPAASEATVSRRGGGAPRSTVGVGLGVPAEEYPAPGPPVRRPARRGSAAAGACVRGRAAALSRPCAESDRRSAHSSRPTPQCSDTLHALLLRTRSADCRRHAASPERPVASSSPAHRRSGGRDAQADCRRNRDSDGHSPVAHDRQ